MNRKTVVKIPTLILVITFFISVMTSCSMKDAKSTETSTKTEIKTDTIQTSDSSAINSAETSQIQTLPYDGNYPQHKAYGTGIGAMPGRVVWSHNPDSVEWDGSGYWWETEHFDEAVILQMVK